MNELAGNDLAQRIVDSGGSVTLTYEEARNLASHKDDNVRRALACHTGAPQEILYFLASDKASEVRCAAAVNPTTPPKAHLKLASDSDAQVRSGLAEKIAGIARGLGDDEQGASRQETYQTLDILVDDEVTEIRGVLSDSLKDVGNAPPATIRKLAMDTEIAVAGPILECSPVLNDDDLLEIIRAGPTKGGVGAISRRATVTEKVADAVVETNDEEAIADLLGNSSAQIREETLDSLVDRAPDFELWHSPLVGRPQIPPGAVKKLAGFVAANLLAVLEARTDLDDETLSAVKEIVQRRIAGEDPTAGGNAHASRVRKADYLDEELPVQMAVKLQNAGKLNDKVLTNAVQADDYGLVLAALAVRSGVEVDVIKKIFAAQSAKGVVALAWKADLSMDLAVLMQQRMARIPPGDVLTGSGNEFPLDENELAWQLEFFGSQFVNSPGNGVE